MIREFTLNDVLYLVAAMRWTLALTAIAFVGGGLVGLLVALFRVSSLPPLRWIGTIYVLAVQGTPLLAWLFVFFFGLSIVGIEVSPWIAAAASYSIYAGAFLGEIWRGALQAIPKQQWEAGSSLGLSNVQIFRYVIIFPALRLMYPALASQFILLMLATSVVSQISAQDLFQAASIIQSRTFRDFEVYAVVAGVYLALALLFRLLFAGLYTLIFARRSR